MSARRISTTKTAKKTAKNTAKKTGSEKPLVARQPQSKQQAAVKSGMFLYTDDAWSLRYFADGDLRCADRELFG